MTDTTSTPDPASADEPVDTTDWKAEARKWEARAKENQRAARQLADLEEASKTDLQKAIDRAEAAERRASEFELSAARSEIAASTGVPVEALRGSSREELEAHAEVLKPFTAAAQQQPPQRGPVIYNPGGTPESTVDSEERAALEQLFGTP